jgi:hypothetical protein
MMKKAVLALATAATIGVAALVTPSPAQAWRGGWGPGLAGGLIAGAAIGGIASSAYSYGPGYGYYGGPGHGYSSGYALLITAGTPQRITTATLLRTTVDIDRVTMLQPIMVPGTGALFAPGMHTMARGIIAVIVIDDARQATLKSGQRKVVEISAA